MSISEAEAAVDESGGRGDEPRGGLVRDALTRLRRNPAAIIGAVLVLVFFFVAIFAPLLAPYEPDAADLDAIRPSFVPGPSAEHWLGLDTQGRDELSRLIYGARQSLLVAVVSLLLGATVGSTLGLLAGAFGGWVDNLVMRIVDIMLAVPGLLFAIGVAAAIGASLKAVMIAIAAVNVPVFARLLRGSMLAQRESDYVLAARSIGIRRRDITLKHVLPNSVSPVIVQGTLTLATAIVDAAGLSFLGLGSADPSVPEWGRMLTEMQEALTYAPQLAAFPGLAIVLAALGFTLLGEALREALDPKFRR
ncbi:MAG: ABC transporter permease subunit [Streptosporangiales bacterium]|nr:ABC transporter permease subunit [Streptosporangiales bacterium]